MPARVSTRRIFVWKSTPEDIDPKLSNLPIRLAREYHRGNIDHWHNFYVRGPRHAVFDSIEQLSTSAIRVKFSKKMKIRDPLWGIAYFSPLSFGIVMPKGEDSNFESVEFEMRDTTHTFSLKKNTENPLYTACQDREFVAKVYEIDVEVNNTTPVPFLGHVKAFKFNTADRLAQVKKVFVMNYTRERTIQRVEALATRYGIRANSNNAACPVALFGPAPFGQARQKSFQRIGKLAGVGH